MNRPPNAGACQRHATRGMVALLLAWLCACSAWAAPTVRLGVLTERPLAIEQRTWRPLSQVLHDALLGYNVQLQLMNRAELDSAIQAHQIDFVLTDPSHAVWLNHTQGLSSPLATLVRRVGGQDLSAYGGVVVVRPPSPLQHWRDLPGHSVAVTDFSTLGSYQLQALTLHHQGVSPKAVRWLPNGQTQDQVVHAVLAGTADAGFVRSNVLESMAREGVLDLRQVRVLEPQPLPNLPLMLSTWLYPEWPVLAMPGTDDQLQRRFTVALLNLQDHPLLRASPDVAGFTLPDSYNTVEELLRTLRLPPFGVPRLSWSETLRLNAGVASAIAATFALLLGLLVLLWHQQRRQQQLQHELAITSQAFNSSLAVAITSAEHTILRCNAACTELLGYAPEELVGQQTGQVWSDQNDASLYASLWQTVRETGHWHGEVHVRHKTGDTVYAEVNITAILDARGKVRCFVSILTDLSWRKKAEAKIERLAYFDPLTGLANRHQILTQLQNTLASSARRQHWGALLFLDLDHFKDVNDTLGHAAGDEVLQETARRIQHTLRESDLAGRLGGDEFLVLLAPHLADRDSAALNARTVAEKLATQLNRPYTVGPNHLTLSVSIGISLFDGQSETMEDLLKEADLAMYQVKQNGRNNICFFDPAMQHAVLERFALQQQLAQAIDNQSLQLYCQPQIDATGRVVGGELLLRWFNSEGHAISPAQFIPVAEKTGLILPLGHWVLQQACARLKAWQQRPALARLRLAINVSGRQFKDPDFIDQVCALTRRAGIAPMLLELEITESVFLGDITEAMQVLDRLDQAGFLLALDDFGTGYSSLSYLAELPFDVIKLDRSFVCRMDEPSQQDNAIVSTIVNLAQHLNMRVLAEGVETKAQHQQLLRHGCQLFQGYLFQRPMPLRDFEAWIEQQAQ